MSDEPSGCIKVFGSATLYVAPDRVVADLGIKRSHTDPGPAFSEAKDASAQVVEFLRSSSINDIRSSRISLNQNIHHNRDRTERTVTYSARIVHQITSDDLDNIESILIGAIDAGANELNSVKFVTSELASARRDARRKAVAAARAKAELYADAAEATLGEVAAIEDVNPDFARRSRGSESVTEAWTEPDATSAYDPGSVEVTGQVFVWYRIGPDT